MVLILTNLFFTKAPGKLKLTKSVMLEDVFPNYPNIGNADSMLGVKTTRILTTKNNPIQPWNKDSLYDCHYKKSVIGIGKILGDDVFYKADILDKEIKLKKGLFLGISKSDFTKQTKIKLDSHTDTLEINCGCAVPASVQYIFKKNKLYRITYNYPLD